MKEGGGAGGEGGRGRAGKVPRGRSSEVDGGYEVDDDEGREDGTVGGDEGAELLCLPHARLHLATHTVLPDFQRGIIVQKAKNYRFLAQIIVHIIIFPKPISYTVLAF